jgi:hypothetical protein
LFQAFALCCHGTRFHISASIVKEEYLTKIKDDSLAENDYLIVKQGRIYDLSDPSERLSAFKQTLALMRYLTKFHLN